MSTLHTVNKSPFTNGSLLSCLKHCKPGDAILLIEDGVYGALKGSTVADAVNENLRDVTIFLLGGDVRARGIKAEKILSEARTVEYDGYVDLVVEHDRTQSWL